MKKIHPQTGQFNKPTWHAGMWRVDIASKHYCAETLERLKSGLKSIGLEIAEPLVPFVDKRTHTEKYRDLLYDKTTNLGVRQEAVFRLVNLAIKGDKLAEEIIRSIPADRSNDARYYTKQIGKEDFLFVTHEDLTEYVDNIVLRARLITELGKLYDFASRR